MDLSNPNNLKSISDPVQLPVSELLSGGYHFSIPSYQRGYRWESKTGNNDNEVRQVDDLLNDLHHFVTANANNQANYYLQPLMVKPRVEEGELIWDVLDGQQRLTTMLLILKCLNEKLCNNDYQLYTIEYKDKPNIDFSKICFNPQSPNYDYPKSNDSLDGFFIRKAKDRIEQWYADDVTTRQMKDKLKEALFYEDNSRDSQSNPNLRVLFIWYNASPITTATTSVANIVQDIKIFNRLNGGKIGLTNSELLKALFLLCIKADGNSFIDEETLVRKWDEMERKFQDNEFWNMISPKRRQYENRLDFLFDFIRESDSSAKTTNSYRYYYNVLKPLLIGANSQLLEEKWKEITQHYDILCKWHENTTLHNYIGYLIEFGKQAAEILKAIKNNSPLPAMETVRNLIRGVINTRSENVAELRYGSDETTIRQILVLFNVEVSEKHREKFSFNLYRSREYDLEHINSQTDNAIVKPQERIDWIKEQAMASLEEEKSVTGSHPDEELIHKLIEAGKDLLAKAEKMPQPAFNEYREKVENYFAHGNTKSSYDKDWIGNLTLLNSAINREYKNALYPQKLRTIKRSDQEGEYIPPCTRYLFFKYYSEIKGHTSAFNMMRWNDDDQKGYFDAIVKTLKEFL